MMKLVACLTSVKVIPVSLKRWRKTFSIRDSSRIIRTHKRCNRQPRNLLICLRMCLGGSILSPQVIPRWQRFALYKPSMELMASAPQQRQSWESISVIPSNYTEDMLKSYMVGRVKSIADLLGMTIEVFAESVNDVLVA